MIFSRTVGRIVFIFVLTTTVNVTFKRRGHIVVILGTDISVVNIGRRMHSVVFLAVAVNIPPPESVEPREPWLPCQSGKNQVAAREKVSPEATGFGRSAVCVIIS